MTDRPARKPRARGNGPGMGTGYGGPAKGAGNKQPKRDFGPTTNAQGHNASSPETRAAQRREQSDQLKDMLFQLAMGGESESARVHAATAFIDRVEGKPLVRQETRHSFNLDEMTDEQLAALAGASEKE